MPNTAEFFIKEQEKSENQSSSVENKIKELKIPQPDQFGKISSNLIRQGHGSGLDADLLDGYEAFQFARRDAQGLFSDGSASLPSISFTNDPDTGWYWIGANNIGVATNGTLRMDIDTADITFTLPMLGPTGSNTAPTYSSSGDSNTGSYNLGSDVWAVTTGGTERVRINSSGQFGIGVSPSAPLHSNGVNWVFGGASGLTGDTGITFTAHARTGVNRSAAVAITTSTGTGQGVLLVVGKSQTDTGTLAGTRFFDLVLTNSTTAVVIASGGLVNPDSRTYTVSSGIVSLQLGAVNATADDHSVTVFKQEKL